MKFIHTADWHLGNKFHGHERTDEHRHFLDWLLGVLCQQQPDALLIAGDIFDTANPPAAAEQMLYDFFAEATRRLPGLQIVAIAGNHDSAPRLEAPAALLKPHNIYIRGTVPRTEHDQPDYDHFLLPLSTRHSSEAVCVCYALPFLRSCDYPAGMSAAEGLSLYFTNIRKHHRKSDFAGLPAICLAHFYAAGAEICAEEHSERLVVGGQDCVPAEVLGKGIAYAALGHIHKAQSVGEGAAYYPGSPIPLSFSEKYYRRGVNLVEISAEGETTVTRLDYTPLRQVVTIPAKGRAATVSEVLDAIAALPDRQNGDDAAAWPYLEIKVEERQPEPTIMHTITEALQSKAAHFCRMLRLQPESNAAAETESEVALRETLADITPEEMLRRTFANLYKSDLPDALLDRFRKAEAEAEKTL